MPPAARPRLRRLPATALVLVPVLVLVLVLVTVAGLVAGCRPGAVELVLSAPVGSSYTYRYEVEAIVARSVDGGPEEVRQTSSVLRAHQRVVEVLDDGRMRAEVGLSRDGGPVQRTVVTLDRAGSLAAVEAFDGAATGDADLARLDTVLLAHAGAPPGPLRPGQAWTVDEVPGPGQGTVVRGSGRLDRLDASGGRRTAVTVTDLVADVDTPLDAGASSARLRAEQRSEATTAYDLDDGAVRWGRARTTGTARVTIDPPAGHPGPPVAADLRYTVSVTTTRR